MLALGLKCMTLALYLEGRNQSEMVQTKLAEVVMERADWQPALVCKVLKEPAQFTGYPHRVKLPIPKNKPDRVALVTVNKVARKVMFGSSRPKHRCKFFNHKRLGKRFNTSNNAVIAGDFIFY
jgi:hypothetical protein